MTLGTATTGAPLAGVKLLTTGGTVATRTDPSLGVTRPSLGADELSAMVRDARRIETAELDQRPSWAFTLTDMQRIALRIRDEAAQPDRRGLVVTVGTSTLEYLSYATDLVLDSATPVVFTGAMRKADEPDPDGPQNLTDAFTVAASQRSRGRGVLVAFASRIMSARGVWKAHRQDNDAFRDLGGDLGSVCGTTVQFVRDAGSRTALDGTMDISVEIVKLYPGAPGALFEAVASRGARGVVVEGTPGAGGVPPSAQEGLARLADGGVLVAISSRAPAGRVPDPPTGGTGSPLTGLDLLSVGDLTTEKAWVLLSMVLGQCTSGDSARDMFSAIVRSGS